MTPLYNGQNNHYKRMLDLQERLRKSEEERIRLEERFNHLVQESRNRHQACISRLRIRYVEFLEEQRVRDERNNKLLGTLDKVDNSLILITAKTERLNVLRKQYEAYLLRVYGNQQRGGSVTADSGLDSQNDQDILPSPIVPKIVKTVSKNSFPFINEELSVSPGSRKTAVTENENFSKLNQPKNASEIRQNLNLKFFSQMPSLTKPIESEPLRPRLPTFSSLTLPGETWKNMLHKKSEVTRLSSENNLKTYSPVQAAAPGLDHYIGKIKQLQANFQEPTELEFDHSAEELEQNTSGDLLNVTLSDDLGVEYFAEEQEFKKAKKRETPNINVAPVPQKQPEIILHEVTPEISEFPSLHRVPNQQNQPIESALAKLANLQEITPLAQTNPSAELPEQVKPPNTLVKEFKANVIEASSIRKDDQKEKEVEDDKNDNVDDDDDDDDDNDDDDDDVDGIEDDYDDTVDIDSWMPDNSDREQIKEPLPIQLDLRNRTRRKLEAIEEVEQPEDEDSIDLGKNKETLNKTDDLKPQSSANFQDVYASPTAQNYPQTPTVDSQDYYGSQGVQDYPESSASQDQQQVAYEAAAYSNENEYNQHYQQAGNEAYGTQQYDQSQTGVDDQQYQYDPNQQYGYDSNAQYTGYENQQYTEAEYANYDYQQYDSTQYQQQYDPSQYGNYQQDDQLEDNEYGNKAYDYEQQPTNQEQPKDYETTQDPYSTEQTDPESYGSKSKTQPKEKKKKDAVRAILDSDSESFIERNLSNTESDFDFN